jgi:hypothetical protein
MKVLAKGALRMCGVGKESGRAYDFYHLLTMERASHFASANTQRTAFGCQDMKEPLNLDPLVMPFFEKNHLLFPMEIEVQTDMRPLNGKYVNTVISASLIK